MFHYWTWLDIFTGFWHMNIFTGLLGYFQYFHLPVNSRVGSNPLLKPNSCPSRRKMALWWKNAISIFYDKLRFEMKVDNLYKGKCDDCLRAAELVAGGLTQLQSGGRRRQKWEINIKHRDLLFILLQYMWRDVDALPCVRKELWCNVFVMPTCISYLYSGFLIWGASGEDFRQTWYDMIDHP